MKSKKQITIPDHTGGKRSAITRFCMELRFFQQRRFR